MIDTTKPIHIRRISTSDDFYSLKNSWNALLAMSLADNFFLRWEWLWTWWKAYEDEHYELCILLVYREKELIGLAPFYISESRAPGNIFTIRRLLFLGTNERSLISEYMDIICKHDEEDCLIQHILEYVVSNKLCHDMSLHKIETSSRTILLLQEIAHRKKIHYMIGAQIECPYISLPSVWEDFLESISGTLRHNIKKNRKKLMEYNDVVFRKTNNEAEFEKDFKEFVRLHQSRWESQHMPGSFSGGRFPLFQKAVMQEMLKNGHLELRFLSVSGKNIAALYNINYKNKIYFYQAGMDSSLNENLSPGLVLHSYCIEDAIQNSMKEYDFLLMGPVDAYKKRWTKECRYMCDVYIALPGIYKHFTSLRNQAKNCYRRLKSAIPWS